MRRSSKGTSDPRDWLTASWIASCRLDPLRGQVHSPSISTNLMPGDSSHRKIRSVSSAVAPQSYELALQTLRESGEYPLRL